MSLVSKSRSFAMTAACAAMAVAGLVSPALAQDRTAWLSSGGVTNTSGTFASGENIYGSCDSDCTDIDMFLYDTNGNLVDQDTAPDSVPVVTAPYNGHFYIQVSMPSCYADACAVAVTSDYGF